MSTNDVRPKTIEGIKRLAKALSKKDGITHAEALSRAALQAGFSNYQHAKRTISPSTKVPTISLHTIYIVVPWRDGKSRTHGKEIIEVPLSKSLDELIKPAHYRNARGLWLFKRWASDKLVCEGVIESAEQAVSSACAAARTLQFMSATGLRPSSAARAEPRGYGDNRIPGQDHSSTWYDPTTKKYLALDEPYAASISAIVAKRKAWARTHKWDLVKSDWPGLYFPDGGSEMYLMADREKGVPISLVENALQIIGPPIVAENCQRVVVPEGEKFVSPAELRETLRKRPERMHANGLNQPG